MGEITDSGLVLEGDALEDARRVIGWAICFSAGGLGDQTTETLGQALGDLCARARLSERLGEPGNPMLPQPLGDDELEILEAAAEVLSDYAEWTDDPDGSVLADFRQGQLEAAERTLALLEEWSA